MENPKYPPIRRVVTGHDAAGRSVVIRGIVRNTDTSLRPGMFARVRLITRDVKEALVHGVRARRSKSGAISFDLLSTE